ncbi:hypothetical protein PG996_005011 [Apiospora saccharicola]|uniref:Cyanovirin-N domain-containing protein n=1 Tax=Apiospora saccharicola TaxID=335842 RepID=A0ABR1VKC4_9PEZI
MASTRLFISALLLLIFAILAAADGGFLDRGCNTTGDPWYLPDGLARTYCATHVCESNVETTLNLNLCIGVQQGQLVEQKGQTFSDSPTIQQWEGEMTNAILTGFFMNNSGNFGNICRNCSILDDYDIQCQCLDEDMGEWSYSNLGLNTGFVYNWFGYLSCFGQHQTEMPISYYCKDAGWQPDPNTADNCTSADVCGGKQVDAGHVSINADAATVNTATVDVWPTPSSTP